MSPTESPFEEFLDAVEISIVDSLGSLTADDTARLYAEILDAEQRLDALRDTLAVLSAARA